MELYSQDYIKQLRKLHKEKKAFGNNAMEFDSVVELIEKYKIKSILDYGCGKGVLVNILKTEYPELIIQGYDPGQEFFSKLPEPAELVSSSDVMEHIEPEYLENVLKHINDLSIKYTYLEISCFPAKKTLSDGRNAHLIVEEPDWWLEKISKFWQDEQILNYQIYDKGHKEIQGKKTHLIYATFLMSKE